MRFVGRGHPAIRATHDKTLEFSPDAQLGVRGTCIVAIDTEADPPAPLAGRVRIRISAGDHRFSLDADANSSWDPTGPAVVRRSPLRLPGTFATGATASAADLPKALVAALQDPDTLITVDVVAVPDDRPTVVLYAADPTLAGPDGRLRAELDRADTVEAQDAVARRLSAGSEHPTPDPAGNRHLVLAATALPRNTRPDARVEVVGLSAKLAAAAASPTPGPLVLAEAGDDPHALLRSTPVGCRLVVGTDAVRLPDLLARAREVRGSSAATVAQEYTPPLRVHDGAAPTLPSRDPVFVCFDAAPADDALDPRVRAGLEALLADGVATRTAARALSALTGWDRRRAYDAVLALRESGPGAT